MSWVSSFFGGKKTTTTTAPDPASASYLAQQRAQGAGAANTALAGPAGGGSWFTGPQTQTIAQQVQPFMNPYQSQVIDASNKQFDQLRGQALAGTSSDATQQGAYGGSRAAVLAGTRLGALDQTQTSQTANLLNSGYQNALSQAIPYNQYQQQLTQQQMMEPLFRQQAAQGFYNGGMGPVGSTQTQSSTGGGFWDLLKGGAGIAATLYGSGMFGGGGGGMQVGGQVPPGWNVPGGGNGTMGG